MARLAPEVDTALAAMRQRFQLDDSAGRCLASVVALVANDPQAPTTVREPSAVLRDHLADSLVALDLDVVRRASTIADIGAGAGFPGLPLAIALTSASVTLVESVGRKCRFMAHLIAAAGVRNAAVVCERVEAWRAGRNRFDVVTARALAPLPVVAEYAAPLLRRRGTLVAWRGRLEPETDRALEVAADELGLKVEAPLAVTPYPEAERRHLQALVKVAETPPRFPRRAGIARKRPLGRG